MLFNVFEWKLNSTDCFSSCLSDKNVSSSTVLWTFFENFPPPPQPPIMLAWPYEYKVFTLFIRVCKGFRRLATGHFFGKFIWKTLYKQLDLEEGGTGGALPPRPLTPPPQGPDFYIRFSIWFFWKSARLTSSGTLFWKTLFFFTPPG